MRFSKAVLAGDGGEFEVEVVERAVVGVAVFPGKPVGEGVVCGHLLLVDVVGCDAGHLIGKARAEPQAREGGRVVAREHPFEPVAERERLKPVGGEITAAPSSRQNPG